LRGQGGMVQSCNRGEKYKGREVGWGRNGQRNGTMNQEAWRVVRRQVKWWQAGSIAFVLPPVHSVRDRGRQGEGDAHHCAVRRRMLSRRCQSAKVAGSVEPKRMPRRAKDPWNAR